MDEGREQLCRCTAMAAWAFSAAQVAVFCHATRQREPAAVQRRLPGQKLAVAKGAKASPTLNSPNSAWKSGRIQGSGRQSECQGSGVSRVELRWNVYDLVEGL